MRRQVFSIVLMVLGMIALVLGFSAVPGVSPAAAAPLLQPSPRPTIPPPPPPPTEEPTAIVPTTAPGTPEPGGNGGGGGDGDSSPAPQTGRITGTVIDQIGRAHV